MNHEARDKAAEFYAEGSFVDANITAEYVAQRGFKDGYDAGHAAAQKEVEESLRVACEALYKIGYTQDSGPEDADGKGGPCRIVIAQSRNRRILEAKEAIAHLELAGHLFTKEGEK